MFGYVEVEDEAKLAQLADIPVCRKWWHTCWNTWWPMTALGKAQERSMREVFHLEVTFGQKGELA